MRRARGSWSFTDGDVPSTVLKRASDGQADVQHGSDLCFFHSLLDRGLSAHHQERQLGGSCRYDVRADRLLRG